MAMQYRLNPPMQSTMGGANLHTPQSVFQHMMGQQNSPQQGGPWLQMPQVPALTMPWSVPALQQPDLIRFTGERSQPAYGIMSLHHKRKLSTPDITDTRQAKQFITEEKMASHFQGLHISSNYQSPNCSPSTSGTSAATSSSARGDSLYDINSGMESTEVVDIERNESRQPRLVISEELKQLQKEPLIPVSLLSKLERPSMALVLWEPPSKHLVRVLPTPRNTPTPIPSLVEDGNNNNNTNNDNRNNNNNNNNNNNIIDLNQSSPQLEPMEL